MNKQQTKKTKTQPKVKPKNEADTPKLTAEEIEAQQLRFSNDVYGEVVRE